MTLARNVLKDSFHSKGDPVIDIPASEFFTTVNLTSLFNAAAEELPESLSTPASMQGRYGPTTLRGMPFALGPNDNCNVILLDQDPIEVPLDGVVATYVLVLHVVEDLATDYGKDLGDVAARFGNVPAAKDGNVLGNHVSNYCLSYVNGTSHEHGIRRRFAIQQARIAWGASAFASVPAVQDVVIPSNAEQIALKRSPTPNFGPGEVRHRSARDSEPASVWLYALPNPQPDKPIQSLRLQPMTERSAVYAITLTQVQEHPLRAQVRRKVLITLPEGVQLNTIGELDHVGIDLGQVISARQQLVYDHTKWQETDPDVQPSTSANKVVVEYVAHPQAKLYVGTDTGRLEAHDLSEAEPSQMVSIKSSVHKVKINVIDKTTRQHVGVRLHLHGEHGEYLPPKGFHREVNSNWFEDNYAEFANRFNQYCYIHGTCEADLPLGHVYVDISRGYEVTPIRTHIEVVRDTHEITFELERVLDWRSRGWVTADTHVHFLSPTTAQLEGDAEDVNVVNLLASQWGEMFSNVGDFDGRTTHGRAESGNDGEFLVRVGSENRMQVLGHISLLGYSGQLIQPLCSGGPSESAIGDALEVTMADWAQRCVKQNGLVVMPHAPNPQCERAADIVLGLVHAMEMMTFNPHDAQITPYGLADWYRFLNLGYHLPVVGGSDKMSASSLLGGVRTYTQLGDRSFNYENWMAATKAGHTFVTVGPLVDMTVEGRSPGSQLPLPESGGSVTVSWHVESVRVPITAVEIVVGGQTTDVHAPNNSLTAAGTSEVKITESTWIAVRVRGGYYDRHDDIAAHSSAVQVLVGKTPVYSPKDAMDVLRQIEGAIAFVDTIAPRPEADAYRKLRLTLESAWTKLHQRMHRQGVYHKHTPLHDHAEHHEH